MKHGGLEEWILVVNMFQNIEEQNQIESLVKFGSTLADVIATDATTLARVSLKGEFVEVESCNLPVIRYFDLSLHEPMTASYFRDFAAASNEIVRQRSEHVEATANPEMIGRGYVEPLISHADPGRGGKIEYVSQVVAHPLELVGDYELRQAQNFSMPGASISYPRGSLHQRCVTLRYIVSLPAHSFTQTPRDCQMVCEP
jgi:hypothetical protein